MLQSLEKFAVVADDAAVADVAVVVVVGAHDLCPTRQSRATQRKATQLNSGTVASLSLALFFIATKKNEIPVFEMTQELICWSLSFVL